MEIGQKLKYIRQFLSLSTREISKELAISSRQYNDYETGYAYPSVKVLTRICELSKIPLNFIMDEEFSIKEINNDLGSSHLHLLTKLYDVNNLAFSLSEVPPIIGGTVQLNNELIGIYKKLNTL